MIRFTGWGWFAIGALQVACGGSEGEAGPPEPDAPFDVVNGVIRASSNQQGLQATLIATHNQAGSMNVTSTSGRICLEGEVSRAREGDFALYWGLSVGFVTGDSGAAVLPALASSEPMSIDPAGSTPWNLADVAGISATISGPLMPRNLLFEATPGGQDPGGGFGSPQELTIFGNCGGTYTAQSGDRYEARFADLENWWCVPQLRMPWAGSSVIAMSWKVVAEIVSTPEEVAPDPFDFCISDIRPISSTPG